MKVTKLFETVCSVLALTMVAPVARAETKASLDVAVGAKAAANPYLLAGPSTGSAAATIEFAPNIVTGDGESTLTFSSAGRYERYVRRYGDDLSGRANLTYERRLSERTRISVTGLFNTSMGGSRDLIRNDTGGLAPIDPVLNPNADVTVTGARL